MRIARILVLTFSSTVAAGLASGPVVIGRRTALALGSTLVLLLIWAAATTWYIAMRDEIAQRVFVREAQMQYGYEDRIRALQSDLEREVTRNLVERNGFNSQIEGIASRQAEIETRQGWLQKLAERLGGHRAAPDQRPDDVTITSSLPSPERRPVPLPDGFSLRLGNGAAGQPDQPAPPKDRLSAVQRSLDALASRETTLAADLRRHAQGRLAQLRAAIGATGLDPDRFAGRAAPAGGPLVPLTATAKTGAFAPLAAELEGTFAEIEHLRGAAQRLPLGRPLAGELEQTSPFGYRLDPFTRGAAIHTGTDFRADYGAPVRATAAGRVTVAEYTGGYGNMVEIDHGGGVVTRYGHLSAYGVSAGDRVQAGDVIGRVGSTGRSTGAHLHYETRIDGEPVDPTRFLAAGSQFAGLTPEMR